MTSEIKGGDAKEQFSISSEARAKELHAKARSYYDVAEQYAYKFLMELKTLRDERLFRELGYKSFDEYCLDEWTLTRQTVNERIKIADTFGEETEAMASKYGFKKSILLSRLDEESRTDAIENGIPTESGRKPAEEASRAEIEEYQRSLKEKDAEIETERLGKERAEQRAKLFERQADVAIRSEELTRAQLEEIEGREPAVEIRTEYVEVLKVDESLEHRIKEYEERFGAIENYSERPRATNLAEVTTSVMTFTKAVRDLAKRHAYLIQYQDTISALDPVSRREYNEAVTALADLARDFGTVSGNPTIINAQYTE